MNSTHRHSILALESHEQRVAALHSVMEEAQRAEKRRREDPVHPGGAEGVMSVSPVPHERTVDEQLQALAGDSAFFSCIEVPSECFAACD
jgi:hypothetical protein